MTKAEFQQYKKQQRFPTTIFREYFEEVCNTKWSDVSFSAYVESQSFINPNYLVNIINKIIVPYYNEKFKIHNVRLLDKNGNLIKELNEITEED